MAERKSSDARIRANLKYEKANVIQISFKLNKNTDGDIIDALSKQENRSGYIKQLIREDMRKRKK